MTHLLIYPKLVRLRMMTNKVLSSRKSYHLGTRVFIRNAPGIGGGGNSSKLASDISKAATTLGQKASTQATPAATKLVQNINPTTSNPPKVGIPVAMLGNYSSSPTYSSSSTSVGSLIPPGLVKSIPNTTTSSSSQTPTTSAPAPISVVFKNPPQACDYTDCNGKVRRAWYIESESYGAQQNTSCYVRAYTSSPDHINSKGRRVVNELIYNSKVNFGYGRQYLSFSESTSKNRLKDRGFSPTEDSTVLGIGWRKMENDRGRLNKEFNNPDYLKNHLAEKGIIDPNAIKVVDPTKKII